MADEMARHIRSVPSEAGGSSRPRRNYVESAGAMRRVLSILALATAVLLAGCSAVSAGYHDRRLHPTGPPTTTATPLRAEAELAGRYRKAGGDVDVSGIRSAKNSRGVLVVTVWTHKKSGYASFDKFATGLASFLTREGLPLNRGYVLNVYGSDGTRLHNYDTTPEHNP
ncbi:hypothetical protein ACH4NT_15680 [Streptomyces lydicus]|uniref:hypothetical protein n=1 Tax=Streptomyces lydicus TaxID=47763 RepID=UPI003789D4DD